MQNKNCESQELKEFADVILAKLDDLMVFNKKYLTTDECAKYLGVTERTVRNHIREGILPSTRPTGGRLFIAREDLEAFIESGKTSKEEV